MTRKITKETINGAEFTVVRKPFDAEWVRGQLKMGIPIIAETIDECGKSGRKARGSHILHDFTNCDEWFRGSYMAGDASSFSHTLTILPALPRNPKPSDAALLYRYMVEDLIPFGDIKVPCAAFGESNGRYQRISVEVSTVGRIDNSMPTLTHAIDSQTGERVEIAITEGCA